MHLFKVIETFSGIGAQAKALKNINADFEIINTVDWDIGAIIAYSSIHNKFKLEKYKDVDIKTIDDFLCTKNLSLNGKEAITSKKLLKYSPELRKYLYIAIKEAKNLVDITAVEGNKLPSDIDLLTYSFPCQDLSLCGAWTGGNSGISRNAHNRSGLLWEIERILFEMNKANIKLPNFLLMENVPNILSPRHLADFEDWQHSLETLGYFNKIYVLDARNFCNVQKRHRAYMISVRFDNEDCKKEIENYFKNNSLDDLNYVRSLQLRTNKLRDVLRTDYTQNNYLQEALKCIPNDTPSRREIYNENYHLLDEMKNDNYSVECITTKQDRNPNSGVIDLPKELWLEGKSKWRYLTPRECFILMGFEEKDFEKVLKNNPIFKKNKRLFERDRLYKLAGNSIVVNVLEQIFKQLIYINDNILSKYNN